MPPTCDHRALRRAPPTSALGVMLAVGLGVAAIAGVAMDACDTRAQDPPPRTIGAATWNVAGIQWVEWITTRDELPLARMLLGSQTAAARAGGGPAAACRLRAALNRHVLRCDRARNVGVSQRPGTRERLDAPCPWPSVGAAAAAYSTISSPRFAADGAACRAGGSHVGRPLCGAGRLARRARVMAMGRDDFAACCPGLLAFIRRWARGDEPSPPECDRVAHTDQIASAPRGAFACGSNGYWPDRESARWPANYVRLVAP